MDNSPRAIRVFHQIVSAFAVFSAVIIIVLMLMVCYEVFMRFFFNRPTSGIIEMAEYFLLFLTFLAIAWVLKVEGHVKIDVVENLLKPKRRSNLKFITSVICAITSLVIAYVGTTVVLEHFTMKLKLTTLLMPPSFIILSVIPLAFLLMFFQFTIRAWYTLKDPQEEAKLPLRRGKMAETES